MTHKIEPLSPDLQPQDLKEEDIQRFRDDMLAECGLPRIHDKKTTYHLPKGKSKLIKLDKFAKLSQALAPEKIEPLSIEDYMDRVRFPGNPSLDSESLNHEKAIRALFEKINEIGEVVNILVEKKV